MKPLLAIVASGAAAVFLVTWAMAQDADKRRSGYQEMGGSLRAMQDDDTANPGMLWVSEGRALRAKSEGAAGKACADCARAPEESTPVHLIEHPHLLPKGSVLGPWCLPASSRTDSALFSQ